jgi:hypothetical protein
MQGGEVLTALPKAGVKAQPERLNCFLLAGAKQFAIHLRAGARTDGASVAIPFAFEAIQKKAIQSFRLRLHSSLRQSGTSFQLDLCGPAEAVPFRFGPQHSICTLLRAERGIHDKSRFNLQPETSVAA